MNIFAKVHTFALNTGKIIVIETLPKLSANNLQVNALFNSLTFNLEQVARYSSI